LRFEAFLRDFFLVAIYFLRVGYPALSIYNNRKKSRKLRCYQPLKKGPPWHEPRAESPKICSDSNCVCGASEKTLAGNFETEQLSTSIRND